MFCGESKFETFSTMMVDILKLEAQTGKLHSYQINALLRTRELLLAKDKERKDHPRDDKVNSKPVLIVAPHGSGKSGIIVLLPYILSSKKVLVLSPSRTISRSLCTEFGDREDVMGFLQRTDMIKVDDRSRIEERVRLIENSVDFMKHLGNLVVCTVHQVGGVKSVDLIYNGQTIFKNAENFFQKFDTLIVDHANYYSASTCKNIVEKFNSLTDTQKKLIFLTDSPCTNLLETDFSIIAPLHREKLESVNKISSKDKQALTARPCRFMESTFSGMVSITHDSRDRFKQKILHDIQKLFKKNLMREPRIANPKALVLVRLKVETNLLVDYLNEQTGRLDFAIADMPEIPNVKENFRDGRYQVCVSTGRHDYHNPDVIACVILRRIVKGKILFNKFIAQCMYIHGGLLGDQADQSIGTILSYKDFGVETLWKERDIMF